MKPSSLDEEKLLPSFCEDLEVWGKIAIFAVTITDRFILGLARVKGEAHCFCCQPNDCRNQQIV